MTARERRHRPPVDPLPHARQRIGIASPRHGDRRQRRERRSRPHRLRGPRPRRGRSRTSIRGSRRSSSRARSPAPPARPASSTATGAGSSPPAAGAATSSTPTRSATPRRGVARLGFGGTLAWLLDASLPLGTAEQARAVVDGLVLGGYDPGRWKTNEPAAQADRAPDPRRRRRRDARSGARSGRVAQWANRARDLANRPPNDLTPERLADRAAEIARGLGRALLRGVRPRARSRRWAWARSRPSHRAATTSRG